MQDSKFLQRHTVYLWILLIASLLSLLPNLGGYQLRAEEPLRLMVSFEMLKRGEFFQPTFLGEPYYNKPPFFNWLIIAASYIVGWSELTPRVVSIVSLTLTALFTILLSYKLIKSINVALLSGLILITSGDVLFWYGYLGEIDITFTLFVSIMFYLLIIGHIFNKPMYVILSGIATSLAFLLKGIPAYAFWGSTVLGLFFFKRSLFLLKHYLVALVISLLIPILWILNTANPMAYINTLIDQAFSRVNKGQASALDHLLHSVEYFALNIKQLFPHSILFIISSILYRSVLSLNSPMKLLILLFLLNYAPYVISIDSQGRYILPLFPVIGIIMGYYFNEIFKYKTKLLKLFLAAVSITILLRLIYGLFVLPLTEEHKVNTKAIALSISRFIKDKDIVACDCKYGKGRSVCVYLAITRSKLLTTSKISPDWTVLLKCSSSISNLSIYNVKLNGKFISLYKR